MAFGPLAFQPGKRKTIEVDRLHLAGRGLDEEGVAVDRRVGSRNGGRINSCAVGRIVGSHLERRVSLNEPTGM